MSEFITLSCPSCGAKLEITQDVNRFACSHCGREHIVNRSGGIVSLSSVVEAINQVKSGVDKTAAELALVRIPKEIAALMTQKNFFLKALYPGERFISLGIDTEKIWEERKSRSIKFLNEQIAIKQLELEHNRKLVSQ